MSKLAVYIFHFGYRNISSCDEIYEQQAHFKQFVANAQVLLIIVLMWFYLTYWTADEWLELQQVVVFEFLYFSTTVYKCNVIEMKWILSTFVIEMLCIFLAYECCVPLCTTRAKRVKVTLVSEKLKQLLKTISVSFIQ